MDLDKQIFILRRFRKAVTESENEMTMTPFIIPPNHACTNFTWSTNGYFKRSNGDYHKTENTTEADFLFMECSCCHQSYYLMNTGAINWNHVPNSAAQKTKI